MAKILDISTIPTHPINAGNRARIYSLLKYLQKKDYQIFFTHVRRVKNADNSKMQQCWDNFFSLDYDLNKINLTLKVKAILDKDIFQKPVLKFFRRFYWPYRIDDWYEDTIDAFIADLHSKIQFDIVIVEYVFLSKVLKNFNSDTLKIIDAHDVFSGRHKQSIRNNELPDFFFTTKRQEARGLSRADIILAIQKEEVRKLQSITQKKVIHTGHFIETSKAGNNFNNNVLLFVASNNTPNMVSLRHFVLQVLPKILDKAPDMKLIIVGNVNKHQQFKNLDIPSSCETTGEVDNLFPHYSDAAIVINPMRFGTGLKIKMIEALGYGIPVVTTSAGAKGLDTTRGAFIVADDDRAFADSILQLKSDSAWYKQISNKAFKYAQEYNQSCGSALLAEINRFLDHKQNG